MKIDEEKLKFKTATDKRSVRYILEGKQNIEDFLEHIRPRLCYRRPFYTLHYKKWALKGIANYSLQNGTLLADAN